MDTPTHNSGAGQCAGDEAAAETTHGCAATRSFRSETEYSCPIGVWSVSFCCRYGLGWAGLVHPRHTQPKLPNTPLAYSVATRLLPAVPTASAVGLGLSSASLPADDSEDAWEREEDECDELWGGGKGGGFEPQQRSLEMQEQVRKTDNMHGNKEIRGYAFSPAQRAFSRDIPNQSVCLCRF